MPSPRERPNDALRALLLDLDGTVADTHALIYDCFCRTLREHAGRDVSHALWRRSVGLPLAEMFAAALDHCDVSGPPPDLLVSRYRARMLEMDAEVHAFPGIPEALAAIRERGIRLAIVTAKHGTLAVRHLQRLGLEERFEVVITGDQCVRNKPDPEPFQRALEALGLPAAVAAGVGDSEYDVRGARAASVPAVAATWGSVNPDALLASGPDRVLESPCDLLGLLP
jgi:HAD superfamily hydrolase (TIGR01549 family)